MKKYEQDLAALRQRIVDMGELCQSMVAMAIGALSGFRPQDFDKLLAKEDQIDQMQLDIDREAVRLLTVYGPVATDLRFVLMVSRINQELERIGDQAVNMFENVRLMTAHTDAAPLPEIHRMAKLVTGMIRDVLTAFFDQNVAKARETIAADDLVDAINDQIVRDLLSDEAVREAVTGPKDLTGALAMILLARSLERIADHATNICEEIIYIVQGADVRHAHSHVS